MDTNKSSTGKKTKRYFSTFFLRQIILQLIYSTYLGSIIAYLFLSVHVCGVCFPFFPLYTNQYGRSKINLLKRLSFVNHHFYSSKLHEQLSYHRDEYIVSVVDNEHLSYVFKLIFMW
jgi:hypothetical protein